MKSNGRPRSPAKTRPTTEKGRPRRVIDTALRSDTPVTEDEKLLQQPGPQDDFTRTDAWRVLRITGEFIEGFDTLAQIKRAVTIFGSARTPPDHPEYAAARETARLLGLAGFDIITGGGPGIMEAGNRGAREAGLPGAVGDLERARGHRRLRAAVAAQPQVARATRSRSDGRAVR